MILENFHSKKCSKQLQIYCSKEHNKDFYETDLWILISQIPVYIINLEVSQLKEPRKTQE